jgi:hypothetical protein
MYEHVWNGGELTQRFFGQVSSEEIKQSVVKFQGDSRFDELIDVIFDFTDCEEIVIKEGDAEEIASLDGAASITNPRIRVTVISDKPAILKAAEDYIVSGLSNYPVKICTILPFN